MTELVKDHLGRMVFSRARAAVFVGLRVPIYFYNVVAPDGWVQGRPAILWATFVAAGIDTIIAWQLRKPSRALVPLRILLDLVYVCLAAIAVPPTWPYSGVLLLLAPSTIELVATRGLAFGTLFVVVANFAMHLARVSVGADPYVFELIFYGAWILVVGAAAFALIELVGRQHQRRFLAERQAFRNLVVLQTRNELLLGRGGAVAEALNRAWHQLEVCLGSVARGARETFRQQQERLAADTREHARYLVEVLSEVAALQRSNRPAVAEHLHLTSDREHRLQVLTSDQAIALAIQLITLNLMGRHAVTVVSSDQVTGELRLRVGGHALHIPPARGRRLALVPAAVIFGSCSLIALSNPIYAGVPLLPVLLAISCTLLVGLAAEHKRQKGARLGVHYVWFAALTPALLALLLTSVLPVHWALADGRLIIPALVGLTATLYIVGIIWDELSWGLRAVTVLFGIAWLNVAIELNPLGAPPWESVIGNLAIPASVVFVVRSFGSRNRDLGPRLHDRWVAILQRKADEIRGQSIDDEIDALQQQIHDANRILESTSDDQEVQAAAESLSEAQRFLDALRREYERQVSPGSAIDEANSYPRARLAR